MAVDILSLLAAAKGAEIQADIDKRVKAQLASPGSETAVRRLIGELRLGKPNYDVMSSALARLTRRHIIQKAQMNCLECSPPAPTVLSAI